MGKINYYTALQLAMEGKSLNEIALQLFCSKQAVSQYFKHNDLSEIRNYAREKRKKEITNIAKQEMENEKNRTYLLHNVILKNLERKLQDEPIEVKKAIEYRLSIPTGKRHLTYSHEKLLEIFSNYYEAIDNDTKISLQQLSDISGITMNQVRLVLLRVGEKPMFKVGLKGESRKKYYPNSYK